MASGPDGVKVGEGVMMGDRVVIGQGEERSEQEGSGQREVVYLLHGIGRGSVDMLPLQLALQRNGFEAVNWRYPSRRFPIEVHAAELARAVSAQAREGARVHFVTHSMGGIVVRHFFGVHGADAGLTGSRLVMVAPPNQGAYLADYFGDWKLFQAIFGPAGQQLRGGERGACAGAGVPGCEFGIIAGGTGRRRGMNPLVPGDNDFTVSVEETRLPGAQAFLLLPYPHALIHCAPRTIRNAVQFLKTGHFLEGEVAETGRPSAPSEMEA